MNTTEVKPLRCAIYTRKSTEHGLEQEFNSLDAQREACEAYVKSQAHEGWRLIPARYDDGGFSGGSLDRPALQRLLEHIRSGLIDVVVLYKVDRLTRSLADFAKLVELFDRHAVSFVSVTQSFNTTTSMGRLTLNVLLSFAQFEREVTGERIRDKIAASKKKGMRMGGPVPLGYEARDKRLVPHAREAEQVRLIFWRYLDLGCLTALMRDLAERAIVTKVSRRRDGSLRGGILFTKGPLAYLLRNRVYVGEVVHKGRHYPGEHEPIVPPELFEAVQRALSAKASAGGSRVNAGSLLSGLIFDDRGNRMSPSTARKRGARYRSYVSCALAQGRTAAAGSVARAPAPEIEALVIDAFRRTQGLDETEADQRERLASWLERVVVRRGAIEIVPKADAMGETAAVLLPWNPPARRRRRELIGMSEPGARPIRSETRARLVEGIAKARAWLAELVAGRVDTHQLAAREGCSERSVRQTLNLAFLAPDLVRAAVEGTLPDGMGLMYLIDAPASWRAQRIASGICDGSGPDFERLTFNQ
jgi:site-specific DNA recombinase